ncbi:MAG: ferritin-like domain-containing protein [Planctomycetota bacterium]|nr:MAG: ferritin-like domain-containing protein [Planctomycetota bacterium]REJ91596.1 MAG: ferritin-like domain-containing protein [Planctomycetota bacterium]REK24484.1 MAG: ferritin-like domain-containing protein [Planctomycetota bacterium]REK32445.1 MAG: ferritin-like domain-containing protein [Planctomycetota bacterium]
MGLFTSTEFDSLDCLLTDQLQDIYDAEQRLVKALPKMADAASNAELRNAFNHHLQETKEQVRRLEQVFQSLGQKAESKTCEAMKGLIAEGEEMVNAKGDDAVRDAALIAAAQRVEHYEMAAYGTVRTLARQLGHESAAQLLQQTLDEESAADSKLTQIAESSVNVHAAT